MVEAGPEVVVVVEVVVAVVAVVVLEVVVVLRTPSSTKLAHCQQLGAGLSRLLDVALEVVLEAHVDAVVGLMVESQLRGLRRRKCMMDMMV